MRKKRPTEKTLIGWREWIALPELGVDRVKVKVDTGARTSALHAWRIIPFERDGTQWVRFDLHPVQRNNKVVVSGEGPVVDVRTVKSASGHKDTRYVIRTNAVLGGTSWPIDITLTNRDDMGFRMLLGRTAIRTRFIIDANRSYLGGVEPSNLKGKKP